MFDRYAIYYTLPDGALADALAEWLGWDAATGQERAHPDLPGLPRPAHDLTERPRKYGAHGTLKPPFFLCDGKSGPALEADVQDFARHNASVTIEGLELKRLGRFLALTPRGDTSRLADLAANIVRQFDSYRAAPSEGELARRRKARLTPDQEQNLREWGYPYLLSSFRFHITLTGPLSDEEIASVTNALGAHFEPLLPAPLTVDAISLLASDPKDGRFHLLRRAKLNG